VIKRYQSGFTLIEMIVAVALSAMVATMAYQSFEGASRNAGRIRQVLSTTNKLDKTWQIIAKDIRNILPPGSGQGPNPNVQPPSGGGNPGGKNGPAQPNPNVVQAPPIPALFQAASLKVKGKGSLQVIMQFTLRGWVNPLGRIRSDMQHVSYRLDEGKLIRDFIPERNEPLDQLDFERQGNHQTLITDVSDVQLRFLSKGKIASDGKSTLEGEDYSERWEPTWPPLDSGNAGDVPIAVEITLEVNGGRSVRLFELPLAQ
jgi:general secretion pathway protein J